MKIIFEKKKDEERCVSLAKQKYDVWPSAYASGAVVRCRQGKIWKDLSEEQLTEEILNLISEELEFFLEKKNKKPDFKKEKDDGLRGWFSRAGGKDGKGWVDCNTCRTDKETGKKTCKTCGRQEGEKRSKYPACRPKPSDCDSSGKGTDWGKKSESVETEDGLLEEDKQYIKNIVLSELHRLFEEEKLDPKKAAQQAVNSANNMIRDADSERKGAEAQEKMAKDSDNPEIINSAKYKKLSAIELQKAARKAQKDAKQMAAKPETVAEQKSNFQKEMEKKGKGWKVRLLTKGKQPAGSAYPNKAPMDRAKSAPPGAGGV
jgi:hypothetical protein